MADQAWEKFWTRLVSGLSLLLMTGVVVGGVAALWTSDWRWAATGALATLLGFGIGCVITGAAKRGKASS